MGLKEELHTAEHFLIYHHIDDPRIEAELLMMHSLGIGRAELYARLDEPLSSSVEEQFWSLVRKRISHEPTAYILKQCQFYGIDLYVDPRVLIPRPETEMLVEEVIEFANQHYPAGCSYSIADIGTGSGAIAIALALNLPQAEIYAIDISEDALEVARINCRKHQVSEHIHLLSGDMLQPLPGPVDILAANLPYVRDQEMEELIPEIRDYEPGIALAAGADGLDEIRRFLPQAVHKLQPEGMVIMEIGHGQGALTTALAESYFPSARIDVIPDLAGIDRIVRVINT